MQLVAFMLGVIGGAISLLVAVLLLVAGFPSAPLDVRDTVIVILGGTLGIVITIVSLVGAATVLASSGVVPRHVRDERELLVSGRGRGEPDEDAQVLGHDQRTAVERLGADLI